MWGKPYEEKGESVYHEEMATGSGTENRRDKTQGTIKSCLQDARSN